MPIPSRIHGMLIIFTWMVDFFGCGKHIWVKITSPMVSGSQAYMKRTVWRFHI